MPTKKKSCELVQHGIAGPTAEDVMGAIRVEYWLPQHRPEGAKSEATPEDTELKTTQPSPQVKP